MQGSCLVAVTFRPLVLRSPELFELAYEGRKVGPRMQKELHFAPSFPLATAESRPTASISACVGTEAHCGLVTSLLNCHWTAVQ